MRKAFEKYLECGIYATGYARARCEDCGHDFLVAFSSKGRGVCPSCNKRHMAQTEAHLSDHVFTCLPVRHWVLSAPKRLSYFMRRDGPELQGACNPNTLVNNSSILTVIQRLSDVLKRGPYDCNGHG